MIDLSHEATRDLLGAHALHALDGDEQAAVAEHLAGCAICRNELDDHLEVAAMLSDGGLAPEGVWNRIEAELEGEAPVIPLFEAKAAARRRRTRLTAISGLAVAAALVLFGLLGATVVDQRNELDDLSAEVAAARQVGDLSEVLMDPDTTVTELTDTAGERSVRAVLGGDGSSFLLGEPLPALPRGQTYQLWALIENDPVSVGVLGNDPSLARFQVDGSPRALMLTREQAGGVDAPTSAPLYAGEVT